MRNRKNPVRILTDWQPDGFAIIQGGSEEEDPYATIEAVHGKKADVAEAALMHGGKHDIEKLVLSSKAKKVGYVRWIETVERGRGIGRKMFEAALDEMEKAGVREVFLIAEPDRSKISIDDLYAFYESMGFEHWRGDNQLMRATLPRDKAALQQRRLEENPGFTYTMPEEHLAARANPKQAEVAFHDAFGIPFEAHLAPVWPKERAKYKRKILNPSGLASYLAAAGDIPQEQFMVALLDQRGMLMGVVVVAKGTINEAFVGMREVFAAAIAARAPAIIGVHNHPSGNTEPSNTDVELTKQLMDVGAIIGIQVLDHIVLGRNGEYTSLAERGLLPKATRRFQNNPGLDAFDFADAFGQSAEPAEPDSRFHLDTLKRGDVVRVGKTQWLVFNNKYGPWVTKHGTSGKKMYMIRRADVSGRSFEVLEMTGGGNLVGAPVASGEAEVVGHEVKP